MVFKKIQSIIAEHLGIDENDITLDSTMNDDLGADSIDAAEILMAIEDEFSVEIPENVMEDFSSLRDIVEYVESQID
ncbi:MAG: acyl carrier protein [Peptostreptococcaceae bacterium]|nr:acyl carrier protein [Peptostreptococcaceae bacterium]